MLLISSLLRRIVLRQNNMIQEGNVRTIPEKPVTDKVSIIIPTHNGGRAFQRNLKTILQQKHIPDKEIIIVDSSSADGTSELARKNGCKVFSIRKERFGHGRTRAHGVSKSGGKHIIMTVQDAQPAHRYSYAQLINFAVENDLVAASGNQIPFKNADSYAMWQHTRHTSLMNPHQVSVVYDAAQMSGDYFWNLDFLQKRKFSCIDDVYAYYSRDLFEMCTFSDIDFAEDVDMAVKILLLHKKIGITNQSSVYHSHLSTLHEIFHRAYQDAISLNTIFRTKPDREATETTLQSSMYTIFLILDVIAAHPRISSHRSLVQQCLSVVNKKKTITPFYQSSVSLLLTESHFDYRYLHHLSTNEVVVDYQQYCSTRSIPFNYAKIISSVLGYQLGVLLFHFGDQGYLDIIK